MKVNMKGHDPEVFENRSWKKANFHEFGSVRIGYLFCREQQFNLQKKSIPD